MKKNKLTAPLVLGGMALIGLMAGVATMAGAQTATVATNAIAAVAPVTATVTAQPAADTPEPGDTPDTPGTPEKAHGHAPLGGDGVVSSVNGTTIVMGEESNEGGASYAIDASRATVTNNGAAGTLADIKVGAKIFVQGTTSGTNVVATSISVGHRGESGDKAGDTDGSSAKEGSESAASSGLQGE